ncbi:hypothetical protein R3X28_09550 [Maribacter sp. TH_r10]|uniref:DUF4380 domain-containing protein n=1 Tax=Maribacter luteus TaxID=2594478 RepID=A0A6I2MR37_9FLAO|nr:MULTISPECIES: hypothetical protein [Maribacter]MDV7139121.1 hypothetical protein [Maribacter sp. TH_r10]MRX65287.1 hypothetical protein [Maribacter luteus]
MGSFFKKVVSIVFVMFLGVFSGNCQLEKYPQTEITNDILTARLFLPDAEIGYYKGTRFDWSGIISSLEYKGHTYFGQWFDDDDPPPFATIMGPVEAYSPFNYNEVDPGSDFVKLGVGIIKKPTNEAYSPFKQYTIVDPGKWKLITKKNEVRFVQRINSGTYSYEYTKIVQLIPGQPKMVIEHRLKNTGSKRIKTIGFNHNFFVIDNQPIGKDFEMTFPVDVSGTGRGLGDAFELQGNKLTFLRDLEGDETIACKYLEGLTNGVEDFDIKIENLRTGAGVKLSGDRPLSRLRLWGTARTLCPEPHIEIKVEAGEEFRWSYFYGFYETQTLRP